MKDKIEKDFIERNKDRDALSEEMIKELRAKGGDNMNGEKRASDKLDSMMAKSNVKDAKYEIYKRALVQDRVKEIFPKESIHSLRKMYDRYMKESGGKLK